MSALSRLYQLICLLSRQAELVDKSCGATKADANKAMNYDNRAFVSSASTRGTVVSCFPLVDLGIQF